MSNEKTYKDLIAFHPGSFVEDVIEDLNITQKEFANRLGTTEKTLSKLINGEIRLSSDLANQLSKLTGLKVGTWLAVQKKYDEKLIEINNIQTEDEKRICNNIDFNYFKKNGFVEKRKYKLKEKIEKLREILNISSLCYLAEFNTRVSFRNSSKRFSEKAIINANVMLEIASNEARGKMERKLNKELLNNHLSEIKNMTLQEVSTFYPRLEELLFECGIVLIGLPGLKNANINGATKKFRNGSVLLLVSDKGKDLDKFWFSFIHELAHIINNDINYSYELSEYEERESYADKYARDFYIPEDKFNDFILDGNFSRLEICDFARELGIHPGIVVGRMQNDKIIGYDRFNILKAQAKFTYNADC